MLKDTKRSVDALAVYSDGFTERCLEVINQNEEDLGHRDSISVRGFYADPKSEDLVNSTILKRGRR